MSRLDETWPYFIDGQPTSRQVADAYVKLVEERDALEERVAALTAENAHFASLLVRAKPLLEDGGSCLLDNASPNAGSRAFALAEEICDAGAASRGTTQEGSEAL